RMFLLLLLSSLFILSESVGRTQSVGIKGKLMCDDKPAGQVKLKLYDVDIGPIDDLLDQMDSKADGTFELNGHTEEVTNIDPKLNIYHDCEDFLPCQRRISILIPTSYISTGPNPRKIYDAGTIQLAGKWAGETRDCLHRL
ncbi:hypothetical protein PFISCL1PPCAC_10524, partial [Pristionchus fissidentatus]